jgi:hypothetical protein
MDLKVMVCESVEWIHLVQDWVQWLADGMMGMKLRVP